MLKKLDLGWNSIGRDGVFYIANALRDNHVREISLLIIVRCDSNELLFFRY